MELQSLISDLRWPLEILALAFAVAPLLILLWAYDSLPERIPMHFGITGRADRWDSKSQAWIIPLIAILMYAGLSVITGTWPFLQGLSVPVPDSLQPLVAMKPGILMLFTYVIRMMVRIARGQAERLHPLALYGLLLFSLAPALWHVICAMR